MKSHAFVAMPFGSKAGHDSQPIDFDRVYAEYIRPALEAAGMVVFRADEDERPGDIRSDMFQELLLADLVVADLTLDSPKVWYEPGVRHALRAAFACSQCCPSRSPSSSSARCFAPVTVSTGGSATSR